MSNIQLNQPYSLLKNNGVEAFNLWFNAENSIIELKQDSTTISTINIEQEALGITVSGSDLLFVNPLEKEDIKYVTKINIYETLQISIEYFNMIKYGINAYSLFIGIEDIRTFRYLHAFNLDTRIVNLRVADGYLVVEGRLEVEIEGLKEKTIKV